MTIFPLHELPLSNHGKFIGLTGAKTLGRIIAKHSIAAQSQQLTVRFASHTEPGAIAESIMRYGQIESKSWKAQHGTAISADNAQGQFYTELLCELARTHQSQTHEVYIADKPAAVDLCIQSRGSLIVLKTTFDERFKEFSPASILRGYYFERLFNSNEASENRVLWSSHGLA